MRLPRRFSVLSLILMAAAMYGPDAAAQPGADAARVSGEWRGTLLTGGAALRLGLTIRQGATGQLTGVLRSIDQGNAEIPATLAVHGDSVVIEMPLIGANFAAALSSDRDTLRGSFRQSGAVFPLVMHRGTASTSSEGVPSDSAILAILKLRVDSGRTPGIVVGILEKGRRRYVAYGTAGPGAPPLNERTLFEIGSISKTFTGLLLADAVKRGEVRLDQPVAELLPRGSKVPAKDGKAITLEQLSTHRSGLPRLPANLAPTDSTDPYAGYDASRLYAFLAAYTLLRAPGESAEYSNLGAGLLGHALTRRAGTASWGALVERRITGRLGMRETFVTVPLAFRNRLATGHDERMAAVPAWHLDALAGAGALRSTAADMLLYLEAALDTARGPIRQAMALARMPRADFAPGSRMALGWIVSGMPTNQIWWHNGGTGGFRSYAAFDPERQVGVVVLVNSAVPADDIGMHLMNPSLPPAMPMLPPRITVALSPEALDRLVGHYALTPTMMLTITREGNALYGQATGQTRFPLTATSPNRFVFTAAGIAMVFDLDEAGPARQMTFRQGAGTIIAPRGP